ncbi:rod shape-determining protein MreC [Patescibacteria group bacterium]
MSLKINKLNIILAVVILLFFLQVISALDPFKNLSIKIFRPIQNKIYYLATKVKETSKSPWINFQDKYDLLKKNIYLNEQIEDLKIKNVSISLLQKENKILRELLDFTNKNNYTYITTEIIGKSEGISNVLIINKGEESGLIQGLAVINSKGLIIGKILKCDYFSSEVLLLNDNQSRIASSILDYEETNGVVEGEYGLSMKMKFIPQNIQIKQNDIIVTSGLEKNIPYGLIIGAINNVESNKGELFQSANIQPLSPLDSSHIVSVIVPEQVE